MEHYAREGGSMSTSPAMDSRMVRSVHTGAAFKDAGPKRVKTMIAKYLETLHANGILHIPDAMLATHMFIALFKGSAICLRLCMNIPPKPSKTEIEHYCRAVVTASLAAACPS